MSAPLADRLAIEELFVRYTKALDAGDVETIVGCFAEDGSLDSPTVGSYAGRAAIREFARRFARFRANGAQLRHMVSNFQIAVDGDRARATCYLLNTITRDGASRLLAPGRYECDLVRVGGQWLFQRRVVILDHAVTLDGV
jgi:uncharacterized protein (TIGR02246 family)